MPQSRLAVLTLLAVFLAVGVVQLAPAQTEKLKAAKFDEFGDIETSDLMARLDFFAVQLQNQPLSKGFILVYRSRRDLPGLSYRYADRMRAYLISTRGLEKERVIAVDGGEADCLRQELWIAPPGAAPVPRSDAYSRTFIDTDSAQKFDELLWGSEDREPGVYSSELEAYAAALRAQPEASAYLIAYSTFYIQRTSFEEDGKQKHSAETFRDPPGTARLVLAQARQLLLNEFHLPTSRIRLRDGGFRKRGGLELWIVPRGEHAPIATPNSFPLPGKH